MVDDEFDLLPHEEVEALRKKVQGKPEDTSSLMDSMKKLTHSLNSILELFKEANEEMKLEERESELVAGKLDPMMEKLDAILDENQKIAKGIITLADMITDLKDELAKINVAVPHPLEIKRTEPFAPKPEFTPPPEPPDFGAPKPPDFDLPPFAPEPPKKEGGLFSKKKGIF